MRRQPAAFFLPLVASALFGCASGKKAEEAVQPEGSAGLSVVGLYTVVVTDEIAAEARARGIDVRTDVPSIEFWADGRFRMGSTGKTAVEALGTYVLEGDTVTLTLRGDDGSPIEDVPQVQIRVLESGRVLEMPPGAEGRRTRLERASAR